jgi:hypothetical protein
MLLIWTSEDKPLQIIIFVQFFFFTIPEIVQDEQFPLHGKDVVHGVRVFSHGHKILQQKEFTHFDSTPE